MKMVSSTEGVEALLGALNSIIPNLSDAMYDSGILGMLCVQKHEI